MIQVKLLFFCGLSLSAIAAFYAVSGLMAIFAASAIAIAIMGTALEISKLVVAAWLYNNWVDIPRLMRAYFVVALLCLLTLTSLGIFGYLSKAHLDQAIPSGDVVQRLMLIDEKIQTQRITIENTRAVIIQMDAAVNQTMARTDDARGAERALQIRRSQARERARFTDEIETAQAEIAKLNTERAPVASEVRKVEAEVGPIKYIAALIYGNNLGSEFLESAVRVVILMIIFVFDPLAVLMLIAANFSLKKERKKHEYIEQTERVAGSARKQAVGTDYASSREVADRGGRIAAADGEFSHASDEGTSATSAEIKAEERLAKAKNSTKKTSNRKSKTVEPDQKSGDKEAARETPAEQHEIIKENKQQGGWNYTVYTDKFTEKDPFSELRRKYLGPRRP